MRIVIRIDKEGMRVFKHGKTRKVSEEEVRRWAALTYLDIFIFGIGYRYDCL